MAHKTNRKPRKWRQLTEAEKNESRHRVDLEVWVSKGGYHLIKCQSLSGKKVFWMLRSREGPVLACQTEMFPIDAALSGPPFSWAESFL